MHYLGEGGLGPDAVTYLVICGPNDWSAFDTDTFSMVGGEYDAFLVYGGWILDGKLNVLLDEYDPTASDSFEMFQSTTIPGWWTYGHYHGWFNEVNLPDSMTDDWFWEVTTGGATLTHIPDPTPPPPPGVNNPGFDEGFTDWEITGAGTAVIVNVDGNNVAELITGSPVTISQLINTSETEFLLQFDYLFQQELGTLDVTLAGQPITTITSGGITGEFLTSATIIDDPSLLGMTDANLAFTFDGPSSGLRLQLDDIITIIPEPSTFIIWSLLGALGLTFGWRRRRRAA